MTGHDRKRKRQSDGDGGTASIKLGAHLQQPPALVSVHGVKLSRTMEFSAYGKPKPTSANHPLKEDIVLHAENERMEYDAAALDESTAVSHYVGIYDEATNTVELYPAPLLHLTSQIKAIKEKELPDILEQTDYMTSRHALGSAFGTKKSRKLLESREMNAVTAASLGNTTSADVTEVITSAVQEAVALMPAKKGDDNSSSFAAGGNPKYIPPPHTKEGTATKDIYKLEDLVSSRELENCNVYQWEETAGSGKPVVSNVSPSYVGSRIGSLISEGDNDKLRILRYIEHLIAFYKFITGKRGVCNRRMLQNAVAPNDDKSIIDGLIDRYTEAVDQAVDRRSLSKPLKTKLYCYLLLLCLKIEYNATMDIFDLVQDLQVDRKDMEQVCREAGAKVKPYTDAQITAMGITKAEATERRICKLSLPLVFPKEKRFVNRRR